MLSGNKVSFFFEEKNNVLRNNIIIIIAGLSRFRGVTQSNYSFFAIRMMLKTPVVTIIFLIFALN